MVTEFGKFTRKLRVDSDELMKDMAKKLGVTTSYLSAVEVGKRKVPTSWGELINENYELTEEQSSELFKLITIPTLSEREINAINAILSVIHLGDSSDYINGLWDALRALIGDSIVDNEGFDVKQWVDMLGAFE